MTTLVKIKFARLLLYGFLGILAATYHNVVRADPGGCLTNTICTRAPHYCTMVSCEGGMCVYTACGCGMDCTSGGCGAGEGT